MDERDFLRNWESLKQLMLKKWDQLKEADLDGIDPVVNVVVDKVKEAYPDLPRKSIIEELENLDQQILKNP